MSTSSVVAAATRRPVHIGRTLTVLRYSNGTGLAGGLEMGSLLQSASLLWRHRHHNCALLAMRSTPGGIWRPDLSGYKLVDIGLAMLQTDRPFSKSTSSTGLHLHHMCSPCVSAAGWRCFGTRRAQDRPESRARYGHHQTWVFSIASATLFLQSSDATAPTIQEPFSRFHVDA